MLIGARRIEEPSCSSLAVLCDKQLLLTISRGLERQRICKTANRNCLSQSTAREEQEGSVSGEPPMRATSDNANQG